MSSDNAPGWEVVIKAPKPDLPFIVFVQAVHDHLVNNVYVTSTNPSLAIFLQDIAAYQSSQTAAAGRGKGAAKLRNAKRKKVKDDLKHIRDSVQTVVDQQTSLADAQAVAESAFMSIKQVAPRSKPELAVTIAGLPGVVKLDAKAVAREASYYWQYSLDGRSWTSVPETLKHVTVISGLTSATVYYFRFRALTRKGMLDWSQVVSLLVH
jgi:hypothetical protein